MSDQASPPRPSASRRRPAGQAQPSRRAAPQRKAPQPKAAQVSKSAQPKATAVSKTAQARKTAQANKTVTVRARKETAPRARVTPVPQARITPVPQAPRPPDRPVAQVAPTNPEPSAQAPAPPKPSAQVPAPPKPLAQVPAPPKPSAQVPLPAPGRENLVPKPRLAAIVPGMIADEMLASVRQAQELSLEAAATWASWLGEFYPRLRRAPLAPFSAGVVDIFEMAEEVLASQRKFVYGLAEALLPAS
jgi:hypothetical protein